MFSFTEALLMMEQLYNYLGSSFYVIVFLDGALMPICLDLYLGCSMTSVTGNCCQVENGEYPGLFPERASSSPGHDIDISILFTCLPLRLWITLPSIFTGLDRGQSRQCLQDCRSRHCSGHGSPCVRERDGQPASA